MVWVYEEFMTFIFGLLGNLFAFLTAGFLEAFSMKSDLFTSYVPYFASISAIVEKFAVFTAILILIVALGKNLLIFITDSFEEPFPLVLKFIASIFFIYNAKDFVNYIINFFSEFYSGLLGTEYNSQSFITSMLTNFSNMNDPTIFVATYTPIGQTAGVVGAFVGLIMVIIISVDYIKLLLEAAERYIVVNLMVVFSPLAASTISSKNTSKIFFSYVRMIFSQMLLLCMNVIFIRAALGMLSTANFKTDSGKGGIIIWIIFFAALCRSGMSIDSYMRSLGLDVVQTGGSLADAILGTMSSMGNASRLFKGGAHGSSGGFMGGVRGIGAAIGGAPGKIFGNTVGAAAKNTAAGSRFTGMADSVVNAARKASGADIVGNGGIMNPNDVKSAISSLNNAVARGGVLSPAPIRQAFESGLGKNLNVAGDSTHGNSMLNALVPNLQDQTGVHGIETATAYATRNGFDLTLPDGRKASLVSNPEHLTDNMLPITTADGHQMYLSTAENSSPLADVPSKGQIAPMMKAFSHASDSIGSSMSQAGMNFDANTAQLVGKGNGIYGLESVAKDGSTSSLGTLVSSDSNTVIPDEVGNSFSVGADKFTYLPTSNSLAYSGAKEFSPAGLPVEEATSLGPEGSVSFNELARNAFGENGIEEFASHTNLENGEEFTSVAIDDNGIGHVSSTLGRSWNITPIDTHSSSSETPVGKYFDSYGYITEATATQPTFRENPISKGSNTRKGK